MIVVIDNRQQCNIARKRRSGLVLVLVLIVVMMLALAGFTFAEWMLTEAQATRQHGEHLRLQEAIHSGIEQLVWLLEQPVAEQESLGGLHDNPRLFHAVPLEPEFPGIEVPANQLRFSVVSPRQNYDDPSSRAEIRFGVENESARLHLADVLRYETEQPGMGRLALLKLPGMTEAVADAILDWIDADDDQRAQGAEGEYYGSLEPPYSPRNALPDCLEELLLIKGVTRELLFGADANYNRILDPDEVDPANQSSHSDGSIPQVPWCWLLTVHSRQNNRDPHGRPRIDMNGPNLFDIHQRLTSAIGTEVASFVVAYRQWGPAPAGITISTGTVPFDPQIPAAVPLQSVLDIVGASVVPSVAGIATTVTYASPLQISSPGFEQQLNVLMDFASVQSAPIVRGLVSVNHAPAEVLSMVPGIDDAMAARIVEARRSPPPGGDRARRHPTWLLTEGVVDLETMKRLLPYLSAGGQVIRAQVVAHRDQPGPMVRSEVVIDTAGESARLMLSRDLQFYGIGHPHEWLLTGAPQGPRN